MSNATSVPYGSGFTLTAATHPANCNECNSLVLQACSEASVTGSIGASKAIERVTFTVDERGDVVRVVERTHAVTVARDTLAGRAAALAHLDDVFAGGQHCEDS